MAVYIDVRYCTSEAQGARLAVYGAVFDEAPVELIVRWKSAPSRARARGGRALARNRLVPRANARRSTAPGLSRSVLR